MAHDCVEEAERTILPVLSTFMPIIAVEMAAVTDSKAATIRKIRAITTRNVLGLWPDGRIKKMADSQGHALSKSNRRQLERKLSKSIGVGFTFAGEFDNAMASEIVEGFAAENVSLIRSIPEKFFEDLQGRIVTAVHRGTRVEELSKEIQSRYGVVRSRADLIGRDQTTKLYGQLNRRRQESVGLRRYLWETVGDQRVRDSHAELEGEEYDFDDPPVTNEDGDTNNPGEDYQCFIGSLEIEAFGLAKKFFRRWFSGELAEIITLSGKTLSVTPNHPVLTDRGWIAAKALDLGDKLIQASLQNLGASGLDIDDAKMPFEKVFDFSELTLGIVGQAGTGAQFHGDGTDEQIDVISLEGKLTIDSEPGSPQGDGKFFLTSSDEMGGKIPLTSQGYLMAMGCARGFSPDSAMGGLGQGEPLGDGGLRHALEHRGGTVTKFDAEFLETACESGAGDAGIFGELQKAFPGTIAFDQIVEIRVRHFEGHVYNLENENGWYIANGLIIHNCRCTATPILDFGS